MNRIKSICSHSLFLLAFSLLLSNLLFADVELRKPQWIALIQEEGSVYLKWFRVQSAARYIVERRVGEEGAYLQLTEVTNPSYNDFEVSAGNVYFYRIIPVDKENKRGVISKVRYIRMDPAELDQVLPPQWGPYQLRPDGIALSWQHEDYDRILAYNIYKRKEGEDTLTLISSSMGTAYLDRDVTFETKYHYVVTALDNKLSESDYSATLSIQFEEPSLESVRDERLKNIRIIEEVVRKTELEIMYSWEDYGFISPADVEYNDLTERLYVSDSGTGLITVIEADGMVAHQIGGKGDDLWEFGHLLGIAVDRDGNVYGVDSYRGEIAVFSSLAIFKKRIRLEDELRQYFGPGFRTRYPGFRFGLVDVEVTGKGHLVIVDNPNGWVYVLDLSGTLIKVIGEKGYEPGKMQYPTFVAADSADNIVVSDTLNSRLQVFSLIGSHLNIVGEKGLGIGQFLRPKGVATDIAGNLYVADSQHNVVQVFNRELDFVGLLGNERGLPVDLGSPNGIAFIEPDRVVICERLSRRIQIRILSSMLLGDISRETGPSADLSPMQEFIR